MTDVTLRRWEQVVDRDVARREIETIFFESSATTSFSSEAARAAFLERWLGRYLTHFPKWFYVAQTDDAGSPGVRTTGYLAGCIDDPRTQPVFADIGYFETFAKHLDSYPAHLHINLAPEFRGAGIGGQLVQVFLGDAADTGVPGVHVVTGANSRNVSFYRSCGFSPVDIAEWNGVENVFLGMRF